MIDVLLYLTKSILAGALFYGFYQLVMRRESYLRFNRYYLLVSALLMVLLPFFGSLIPFNLFSPSSQAPIRVITLPEVVITGVRIITPEQEKAFLDWAIIGYVAITSAMLIGLLLSIYRIVRFYRSAMNAEKLENNIYVIPDSGSPFSFLGRVFISRQYAQHPGLKSIIIHENAHIRQLHLIDLIFLEILSSIFWFNPFFFLIKRALREVHEYLADREVIRQGEEALTYQKILFNEVSGNPQYIIANNFNLLTKKRIVMLIKKSGKMAAFRIGMLLPLLIAASFIIAMIHSNSLMAQSKPTPQKQKQATTVKPVAKTAPIVRKSEILYVAPVVKGEKNASSKGKEDVYTSVEEMPAFPGGDEARIKYMVSSIKYPEEALKKGITGTVYVTFIVETDGAISNVKILRGIGGGCDEEALRVIKEMPAWIPGKEKGKLVRTQFNMPIKFALS
jgi:TonB family protein